ncbi:hypothetical protein BS47DRAFT_1370311 [Hydnum rufescens UP504]|uniref:Sodium/calcium exchanger membrane region domain-containing protein n=1 Tax=Hydnum rufescens UP504 TaxID=1448309 RepID=A0A9P6BB28_9AGAM|nr:hypothetical protein BS47DRAFT_1370311 [Hydnum rufescens UP504]
MACVKASWLNVLLVFIPVSVTCFLAIIPLAKLLAFGTEELAIRVGQTLGGLLNATRALQCKLRVVQASLVGSLLSNLLLVLGMCFFAGGTRFSEQGFMQTAAQLNTSLLILSVTAILIPAGFKIAIDSLPSGTDVDPARDVLKMSHGVAIVLLIIYGCTLVFQLWTHAHLYKEDGKYSSPAADSIKYPPKDPRTNARLSKVFNKIAHPTGSEGKNSSSDESPAKNTLSEDVEILRLTRGVAFGLLVIVTVLVAITAEFLVSSIDGLTKSGNIGEEWVGLILLPIVGNAAEHVTAVTVSVKDKLDLSIGVAVGSSIQIALFVIPLLVILGWIMGKPLTLLFDPFECIVLFLAVLTVAFIINDGRSNWLEGMILMSES